MDLNTIWFALVGVLLIGYAILDGFDLGIGVLHLFTTGEYRRRVNINAIGPVWDGNEVWLLTGGGALFAAFPAVYATVFSAFYLALTLLLCALIFRAVSFEFRGKIASARWRALWDYAFGIGSLLSAILLGVAFGNILRGLPIDASGAFTGSFLGLLNPYALLVGLLTLASFVMHGAIYMTMKTDSEQREWFVVWATRSWMLLVALYFVTTMASLFVAGFLFQDLLHNLLFWPMALLLLAAVLYIPVAIKSERYFAGFVASSITIACMIGLGGLSLWPRIVPSTIDLAYSLTVYNASSTPGTLTAMLVVALIGMPFVIGYTTIIYRVFKGKVTLGGDSY